MADLSPLIGIGGTVVTVPASVIAMWRYILRATLAENRALKATNRALTVEFDDERKLRLAAEASESRASSKLVTEQETATYWKDRANRPGAAP